MQPNRNLSMLMLIIVISSVTKSALFVLWFWFEKFSKREFTIWMQKSKERKTNHCWLFTIYGVQFNVCSGIVSIVFNKFYEFWEQVYSWLAKPFLFYIFSSNASKQLFAASPAQTHNRMCCSSWYFPKFNEFQSSNDELTYALMRIEFRWEGNMRAYWARSTTLYSSDT